MCKGINYLHYFKIFHFPTKSSVILLKQNWKYVSQDVQLCSILKIQKMQKLQHVTIITKVQHVTSVTLAYASKFSQ